MTFFISLDGNQTWFSLIFPRRMKKLTFSIDNKSCQTYPTDFTPTSVHIDEKNWYQFVILQYRVFQSLKMRIFIGPNPREFCLVKRGLFKFLRKNDEKFSRVPVWPIFCCLVQHIFFAINGQKKKKTRKRSRKRRTVFPLPEDFNFLCEEVGNL